MSDERQVQISPDADTLAATVAAQTIAVLGRSLATQPVAHLAVTSGSILIEVQTALADPNALDWSRVHVWWGDERFVPAADDERNDLPEALSALPFVVHRMAASDGPYADADAAAQAYVDELKEFAPEGRSTPNFDVGLIGVGPDGHCCSLQPHQPALTVRGVPVTAVYDSPKPPPTRLSFTFDGLAAVRELYFVASGEGKAAAVAAALGDSPVEDTPAGAPRGIDTTVWFVDEDAASQVPR